MADGIRPRHSPMWTIALSDHVATHRRLIETLRRVPARLVPGDHPEADFRLAAQTEPGAGVHSRTPLIVVADVIDETLVRAVMRSAAAGIIPRDVTVEEARGILSAVATGSFPIPHHLAVALATRLEPAPPAGLTEQERIILDHLAHGDTITIIARRLGCSERHTRRHLRTLWNKMGVNGRAQGLVAAARQGLLTL